MNAMEITLRMGPTQPRNLKGPYSETLNFLRPLRSIPTMGRAYDVYVPMIAMESTALKAVVLPN